MKIFEDSYFFMLVLVIMVFSGCVEVHTPLTITIENTDLKVEISPVGAELQSIFSKKSNIEYLWQGDSAFWAGRSPVMFPVNVRFKEERYSYQGKKYEMPRMGLAISRNFSIKDQSTEKVILILESDPEMQQYYPFNFSLEIEYRLDGTSLSNQFRVSNHGRENMYFALGGHPGFRFPKGSGNREDFQYIFSKKITTNRIKIENSLVQADTLPFLENENTLRLSDPRIPNAGMFMKNSITGKIGIGAVGGPPFVTVDLGDFPNVNLWSPPGMPFACIEPMVSHHDTWNASLAIEEKEHLTLLPGGETAKYAFFIEIHK